MRKHRFPFLSRAADTAAIIFSRFSIGAGAGAAAGAETAAVSSFTGRHTYGTYNITENDYGNQSYENNAETHADHIQIIYNI
ncbi:MAG: hypothetical protein ACLR56_06880 [Oscillospiraceae bacterium]